MATITLTDVQQDLSYLLSEQSVPSTGTENRQRFIQRALERAYRAYDFPMNKVTATIQMTNGVSGTLTFIGQDSVLDVRQVVSGSHNDNIYYQIPYEEQDSYAQGSYRYWLTGYEGAYVINTTESTTSPILTVRYTTVVPQINASIPTPFPSSMCLARGALIYYRQAEDPQADIAQEEALFQQELDEVIAAYNRSRPAPRGKTLHEREGTYVGDISTMGVE